MSSNIVKNLNDKYSRGMLTVHQKLLDHAKKSAADTLKTTSKRTIQKTAEATGEFNGNKSHIKITRNSPQKNLETLSQTEGKSILILRKYMHISRK